MAGKGGAMPGAGRKPKADEQKVRKLGLDAIVAVYGSVEAYYQFIAQQSKESFPHLKLLQEYVYGKPKESLDVLSGGNPINSGFNLSSLSEAELAVLIKIHERHSSNTNEE